MALSAAKNKLDFGKTCFFDPDPQKPVFLCLYRAKSCALWVFLRLSELILDTSKISIVIPALFEIELVPITYHYLWSDGELQLVMANATATLK